MPILLALSVLALVALLWATISIAGFVRRARRRRRRRLVDAADSSVASLPPSHQPLVFLDPELEPLPAAQLLNTPSLEGAAAHSPMAETPVSTSPMFAETVPRFATPEPSALNEAPPPPIPSTEPPPRLRSFPTRLGKRTLAAAHSDDGASTWNPFSKDFRKEYADLSDPVASRHITGQRTRNKDLR